jgi:hypothetical protein
MTGGNRRLSLILMPTSVMIPSTMTHSRKLVLGFPLA